MNPFDKIKEEHSAVERELLELETIMQETEINYPNLVHVLNSLFKTWKEHEEKEELAFKILKTERILVPVKKMLFEHGVLRPHRESLVQAINSGSDINIKIALDKSGKFIIDSLRDHIKSEDEVLYTIAPGELTSEELQKIERIFL